MVHGHGQLLQRFDVIGSLGWGFITYAIIIALLLIIGLYFCELNENKTLKDKLDSFLEKTCIFFIGYAILIVFYIFIKFIFIIYFKSWS